MGKDADTIGPEGERRDAELFEENLVDGAWIPLGFAWQSPSEIRSRAEEMEEFADEELSRDPGEEKE
ncbi:MAG: hypothetical protein ACM3X6_07735 [Patescibacteria group bacterium]